MRVPESIKSISNVLASVQVHPEIISCCSTSQKEVIIFNKSDIPSPEPYEPLVHLLPKSRDQPPTTGCASPEFTMDTDCTLFHLSLLFLLPQEEEAFIILTRLNVDST